MARKRMKRGNDKDEHCCVDVDRISALPDAVIHHILSFVPTVFVVRMSVLSKQWRRVWHSVPTLHLPYLTGFEKEAAFVAFVDKCMERRRRAMSSVVADSSVTSLKLGMHSSLEHFDRVNKWLHSSVVMNSVKELELCFRRFNKCYSIPPTVLNARCLTHLKLGYCVKIAASCLVNFPSLKSLCLTYTFIDRETLCNLVLGCPSLEKFVLLNISYNGDFRISSTSLKFLDVEFASQTMKDIDESNTAQIEATNLQSLVLHCSYFFRYDFSALMGIKDLVLTYVCCTKIKLLEDQIPKLASLENFALEIGFELKEKEMSITNRNLKRLSFVKGFKSELKLTVTTSCLVSLNYRGGANFGMSTLDHQAKGRFFIKRDNVDKSWYTELKTFLANVNCSWKSVDLYVYKDWDLIVPKKMKTGNPPWPELKHLKVTTRDVLTRRAQLRQSLKWLCPSLETLSIREDPDCSLYNQGFRDWIRQPSD